MGYDTIQIRYPLKNMKYVQLESNCLNKDITRPSYLNHVFVENHWRLIEIPNQILLKIFIMQYNII